MGVVIRVERWWSQYLKAKFERSFWCAAHTSFCSSFLCMFPLRLCTAGVAIQALTPKMSVDSPLVLNRENIFRLDL